MRQDQQTGQMNRHHSLALAVLGLLGVLGVLGVLAVPAAADVGGWLEWRGPGQDGVGPTGKLPPTEGLLEAHLAWTVDLPGRGTAVVARYEDGDRVYALGYRGEGAALQEVLVCIDPKTGEHLWSRGHSDFISDIIYNRYSIGAPAIDPETGHVFIQTSPGLLIAYDREGNELWQRSLLEEFGRLTFPNGRTGPPTIDGNLVVVNAITSNWGREGPGANRFYAFEKTTGRLVWTSDPGPGPPFLKDSSFSTPYYETRADRRVFYAGTGDGNLICADARTGQPLWRVQMAVGGVNSSPVVWPGADGQPGNGDDLAIQVHGKENVDDTGRGYMIGVKLTDDLYALKPGEDAAVLGKDHIAWRNDDVQQFTSSPTLVGGVVYVCTLDGHLAAIDAATGKTHWKKKMSGSQLHASPLFAGGRLWVPMWNDGLYVITPTADPTQEPSDITLVNTEGQMIGSPSAWNGQVFVHTTDKLYAFGQPDGSGDGSPDAWEPPKEKDAADSFLQVVPAEFLLRPGGAVVFDAAVAGRGGVLRVPNLAEGMESEKWVPPTAKVHAELSGTAHGRKFVAAESGQPSAGALKMSVGPLTGTTRGRVLPGPPYAEDFEASDLAAMDPNDKVHFAHPPLPWIGARLKWQVREENPPSGDATRMVGAGNKVLAKTLDRVLFQRSMVFLGHPDDRDYTVTADVMTDGNRRGMGVIGVINQRYIIAVDGNKQQLEVSSNHDRVKRGAPLTVKPGVWYRLVARVDVNEDGSGVVRGKAWPVGEDEPEGWTIEAEVPNVHREGSPGVYGFSPQNQHRVYIDNLSVTPNQAEE